MPQALETLCHIQFWSWKNSLFPLLALWGNKNWPPSMKVKKMEIFQNKVGLMGCKWSSLNAPGIETHLSHPTLKLGEFPFIGSLPEAGCARALGRRYSVTAAFSHERRRNDQARSCECVWLFGGLM